MEQKRTGRPLAVFADTIITPTEVLHDACVVVRWTRIERVQPASDPLPDDVQRLDMRPHTIVPGFVDLHSHGGLGHAFVDASLDCIIEILRARAATGCTSLLATLGGPFEPLKEALDHLSFLVTGKTFGTKIAGLHLEGPYLNPARKGAIPAANMRRPDCAEFQLLNDLSRGTLLLVTIAPEIEGALDLISYVADSGVAASIGHTDATYEQVGEAIAAGATHVCHAYNAMRPFHHREPGALGAALTRDELSVELIGDGAHVHPAALKLAVRAKGLDKTAIVTDNDPYSGLPDGSYRTAGGAGIIVDGPLCRHADGTICGSTSPMDQNLRNVMAATGLALPEAVRMATLTPARIVGIDNQVGSLAPGRQADLVVLDDCQRVLLTMADGQVVYRAAE